MPNQNGFRGILVPGFFLLALATAHAESEKSAQVAARVVSLTGTVTADGKPIHPGDTLRVGQVVKTEQDGEVKLIFPDRSIVDLSPKTSLKLLPITIHAEGDAYNSQLDFGRVRASVQKKLEKKSRFYIKTRSSVLAVRGTEFLVSFIANPGTSNFVEQVTVAEGAVEVAPVNSSAPPVMLNAGTELVRDVIAGGNRAPASTPAPRVAEISPAEARNRVAQATVSDRTFNQAIIVNTNDSPADRVGKGGATLASITPALNNAPPPFKADAMSKDVGRPEPTPGIGVGFVDQLPPNVVRGNSVKLTVTFTP